MKANSFRDQGCWTMYQQDCLDETKTAFVLVIDYIRKTKQIPSDFQEVISSWETVVSGQQLSVNIWMPILFGFGNQ